MQESSSCQIHPDTAGMKLFFVLVKKQSNFGYGIYTRK